jgi:phage shock protein A
MAFGARQRFVDEVTPPEPDLTAGLSFVVELLKDPKKSLTLAQKAQDAQRVIDQAAKATADLRALQQKTDGEIAAKKAEIARLEAEHKKATEADRKQLEADRAAVKQAQRDAAADRAKAAEVLAEHRRRVAAAERAMSGAA